jgi:hypothetical protein
MGADQVKKTAHRLGKKPRPLPETGRGLGFFITLSAIGRWVNGEKGKMPSDNTDGDNTGEGSDDGGGDANITIEIRITQST